jgi:hypothetical protein
MKLVGLQSLLVLVSEPSAAADFPEDGTDVTDNLNGLISASTDGGVYTNGKGVIVRAPDFITSDPTKVVPGTFWSNDIFAPSQMYPTRGNPWFPNTGWDGYQDITWQTTDLPDGPWTYASVGAVVGSSLNQLYPNDFDKIQAQDWGWGVFFSKDSNAVDQRCERWDDNGGYDCNGGWLSDDGNWDQDNIHKGSGNYMPGNPAALGGPSAGYGGGAGCHFDSNTKSIDQPDAWGDQNLVGNANCECNYGLNGNDWEDWFNVLVNNLKQKDQFQDDRPWLGGSGNLAPSWAMDASICWVSNPRDLINMQNQLYWKREEWNNQMVPTSDWSQNTAQEMRKYWGWNEVPVDRNIVEDPLNWDAVIIKLPAAICDDTQSPGALGGQDSLKCLGNLESQALEDDLDSFVQQKKLYPGVDNVANRPGSYVVLVREWGNTWAQSGELGATWNGINWQKYFFCENWQSPSGKYQIVHMKPSQDPNKRGACYLDYGGAPAPPSPTPPSPPPTPSPHAGSKTIEHVPSGKCLAVQDDNLVNGNALVVTACDQSDQQKWNFADWSLKSLSNTGICVDAPNGQLTKGNGLQVWDCNGQDAQKFGYDWKMDTIYASSSSDASLCLDVQNGGNEDVNVVWLWECYGGDNQKFHWHNHHFVVA